MNATTLAKWVSVAAVLGTWLIYLKLALHVYGVAGRLGQARGSPVAKAIVPASVGIARVAIGPRGAHPPSSGEPGTRFRFGFLEFEDDLDAPGECILAAATAVRKSVYRNQIKEASYMQKFITWTIAPALPLLLEGGPGTAKPK